MKIAISGLSGSGNSTASTNVSKALGLKIINYTYRQLAADLRMDFEEVRKKAEETNVVDYTLDKLLLEKANEDNIILATRLACWLIDADLRIWLHAPFRVRAKRIAEREGKEFKDVLEYTKNRDRLDLARYKKIYGINLLKHDFVDFVINTENLDPRQVSEAIVAAAKLVPLKRKPFSARKKILKILDKAETLELKKD